MGKTIFLIAALAAWSLWGGAAPMAQEAGQYCRKFEEAIIRINSTTPPPPPDSFLNLISSSVDCKAKVFGFTWHLEPGRQPTHHEKDEFLAEIVAVMCRDGQGWQEALAVGWRIVALIADGDKELTLGEVTSC
jgi:hypothetical protein